MMTVLRIAGFVISVLALASLLVHGIFERFNLELRAAAEGILTAYRAARDGLFSFAGDVVNGLVNLIAPHFPAIEVTNSLTVSPIARDVAIVLILWLGSVAYRPELTHGHATPSAALRYARVNLTVRLFVALAFLTLSVPILV